MKANLPTVGFFVAAGLRCVACSKKSYTAATWTHTSEALQGFKFVTH
jgi:hypothetical protein